MHGTNSHYTQHKCKCDACRAAHAQALREWRARNPGYSAKVTRRWRQQNRPKTTENPMPKPEGKKLEHGTYVGYVYHKCRCPECTAANTEYGRQWRALNPNYHRIDLEQRRVRNEKIVDEYKLYEGCSVCGLWDLPADDYHLIHGGTNKDKAIKAQTRTGGSVNKLRAEMAKCDVTCTNCLKDKT